MHNNRHTILAINPGTRYLGIAILRGPVLIDWSVKVINGRRSSAKLDQARKLVSRIIDEHQPDVLVLKQLHSSRSSENLDCLSYEIEAFAIANCLKLAKYSIQEVEAFHAPKEKINKTSLAELICHKHPVLRHELRREQNNLNHYYIRMFEAVALGDMAAAKSSGIY